MRKDKLVAGKHGTRLRQAEVTRELPARTPRFGGQPRRNTLHEPGLQLHTHHSELESRFRSADR